MRKSILYLSGFMALASTLEAGVANAAFFSYPRLLGVQIEKVTFDTPMLAPMGHIRFCLHHPKDCEAQKVDFRKRQMLLTVERWEELNLVNRQVNRDIAPDPTLGPATEEWKISPASGNCHDYAVTKRHELLARGWPARDLLLAEVIVPSGEHHLILVVRTKNIDLVLDNLNANIRAASATRYQYQWVRIESPHDPRFWAGVNVPSPTRVALASDYLNQN